MGSSTRKFSTYACYGLLGGALGAVAVPIYIQVPYLYTRVYEVPSAWVGLILLLSRLLDALLDPAIGLWIDKRTSPGNRYALPVILATPFLLLGMGGVFFPFGNTPEQYAASLLCSLLLVHLGYSLTSIAYQAWGAELGNTDKERSTFVAVREGTGMLGVVFAVSFALESHAQLIFSLFAVSLLLGLFLLLKYAPRPVRRVRVHTAAIQMTTQATGHSKRAAWNTLKHGLQDIVKPLKHTNFRRLMSVFLCNGLAAALPATLVPFYMRDHLGLSDSDQWVLAVYFSVGALSTVFWVWLSGKTGLTKAWLLGMVISVPAFVIVVLLNRGDLSGYLLVCLITGFALGADLALPAALLARIIEQNGDRGTAEGTYFGLWNWANKLNLALAPTIALGILQWFNHSANAELGASDNHQTLVHQWTNDPLIWVYALLPCALKLLAIILLAQSSLEQPAPSTTKESP